MKGRIAIAILFALLVALCAWGQTFQRSLPFLAKNRTQSSPPPAFPTNHPGLWGWWVSSDLPTNSGVATWPDRAFVNNWTNTTISRPTNTATGVRFYGTNVLRYGTISPPTSYTTYTSAVFCVFTPVGYSDVPAMMIAGDNGGRGICISAATIYKMFGEGNSVDIFNWTQRRIDMLTFHSRNGADVVYTNGILAGRFSTTTFCGFGQITDLGWSRSLSKGWSGWITELAIYTNVIVPEAQLVTTLHAYATNTYGFSP